MKYNEKEINLQDVKLGMTFTCPYCNHINKQYVIHAYEKFTVKLGKERKHFFGVSCKECKYIVYIRIGN